MRSIILVLVMASVVSADPVIDFSVTPVAEPTFDGIFWRHDIDIRLHTDAWSLIEGEFTATNLTDNYQRVFPIQHAFGQLPPPPYTTTITTWNAIGLDSPTDYSQWRIDELFVDTQSHGDWTLDYSELGARGFTDSFSVGVAVPEPSTWAMMTLGLGAGIVWCWRKRK